MKMLCISQFLCIFTYFFHMWSTFWPHIICILDNLFSQSLGCCFYQLFIESKIHKPRYILTSTVKPVQDSRREGATHKCIFGKYVHDTALRNNALTHYFKNFAHFVLLFYFYFSNYDNIGNLPWIGDKIRCWLLIMSLIFTFILCTGYCPNFKNFPHIMNFW